MHEPFTLIKQQLVFQNLPVYPSDLPFIWQLLETINEAETALQQFSNMNSAAPLTVVDQEAFK